MPRFPPMGVSAVVDGYQDYVKNVGKMADATERSHSRIGSLGRVGFSGLVKGAGIAAGAIVGIGAAAAGAVAAVGGLATKLAIDAAPLVDLEMSFNAIAEAAGRTGPEVVKELQNVTAGTIRAADLMQLYNKGTTLLGENFNDIIPIMGDLIAQGAAIGLSPLQAVEDFTTGVARESKMILDNLGITVQLSEAHETFAKTIGKSVTELTAAERQAALLAAAQRELQKTSENLPDLNEFATTSLAQLKTQFADTKDEIGKALVPALKGLIDGLKTGLGGSLGDVVAEIKNNFVPFFERIGKMLGIFLPKFITFAVDAFKILLRVIVRVGDFMSNFVVPAFEFFADLVSMIVIPIVNKALGFFEGLFGSFAEGEEGTFSLGQALLSLIPQPVLDAVEGLKTKVGEWYEVAKEWYETHSPEWVQAFTDVKDYIVNTFIPDALNFLADSFAPVIEEAGKLWTALQDDIPEVEKAWDGIKKKANEVFQTSIPSALSHLSEAWEGSMELWRRNIEWLTKFWGGSGDSIIATAGKIIEFAIGAIGHAIELLARTFNIFVQALLGDWDRVREIFEDTANWAAGIIEDLFGGTFIGDFLDIDNEGIEDIGYDAGESYLTGWEAALGMESPSKRMAEIGQSIIEGLTKGLAVGISPISAAVAPTPALVGGGSTSNFNMTINTASPVEPIAADFRMMAALARRR